MDIWTEIMEAIKPIIETGKFVLALTFVMAVVRFGNWAEERADKKNKRKSKLHLNDNDWY